MQVNPELGEIKHDIKKYEKEKYMGYAGRRRRLGLNQDGQSNPGGGEHGVKASGAYLITRDYNIFPLTD